MSTTPRGLLLDKDAIRKFKAIVAREKVFRPLCAQLDPDGIGANLGKKEIIEQLGAECDDVYYGGEIDDEQNAHIIQVLKLKLRPMRELPAEGACTMNDSCKLRDARFGIDIDPRRIVDITDHHEPTRGGRLGRRWRFVHIVPDVGSACTVVHAQGKALGTAFSPLAATALALGIHNDTNKLRSPVTTDADRFAFAELASMADQKRLAECHNYPLSDRYFDLTAPTYAHRKMIGPFLVAHPNRRMHVGESGTISRNANRLRQHPDCRIVMAWCLTERGIRVCVRAKDVRCRINPMLDAILGKGFGGGKHGEGGGFVPLSQLPVKSDDDFDDEMIAKIESWLDRRIARYNKKTPA